MFKALRHRNLRLYLSGQFISQMGTWMQQLALSWLVYRLTHSAFWLGVVTFAAQIPSFFLGLFAGVFVDRMSRYHLLMATQGLSAIQALVLSYLTLTGQITLPEILGLSLFLGVVNAVDMPTRQAFVIEMIHDKRELANAIALNSSVMNGTRLIGPAIAGIVIASFGEGICFLVNAVSYLAVLYALNLMKLNLPRRVPHTTQWWVSVKEGMDFVRHFAPIGVLLVFMAILSLVGAPYVTLLPAMADQVFHGGAHALSVMSVFSGCGAFGAAFWLASRTSVMRLGLMINFCGFLLGVCLIGLSFVTRLELALPILFLAGFTMMAQMASSNVLIQTLVPDDKRGRVMSLFNLCLVGVSPIGSLLMGALGEKKGLGFALLGSGGLFLGVSVWFYGQQKRLSQWVVPLYAERGILPEKGWDFGSSFKDSVF